MPFKDPNVRREYIRQYQRERRQGIVKPIVKPIVKSDEEFKALKIKTAKDVLDLLEKTLNMVIESETDVLQKARTIAYVAGVTLKAVELGELEERVSELEEQVERRVAQ